MDGEEVNKERRRFLLGITTMLSGVAAGFSLVPLLASWLPSASARAAAAPVTCDLSHLAPGEQLTVEWRGKPVWIIRRSQAMLDTLKQQNKQLRDPNSLVEQQPDYACNLYRSRNPEYLVLVGICTHLGCSPKYYPQAKSLGADWPGGFYCPCHGSSFDLSGRVYKGVPAPINLEVPPYSFIDKHTIVIGIDEKHQNG